MSNNVLITPIFGLNIESRSIIIEKSDYYEIKLYKLKDQEKNNLAFRIDPWDGESQPDPRPWRMTLPHKELEKVQLILISNYDLVKTDSKIKHFYQNTINHCKFISNAMNLIKSNYLSGAFYFEMIDKEELSKPHHKRNISFRHIEVNPRLNSFFSDIYNKEDVYVINKDTEKQFIEKINGLVPKLKEMYKDGSYPLWIAQYFQSYRQLNSTTAFINLVICLEAIFGSALEQTYKISNRVARFIETDFDRRVEMRNQVKKIYGRRSNIVHGSRSYFVEYNEEKELREIVRRCINKLFSILKENEYLLDQKYKKSFHDKIDLE